MAKFYRNPYVTKPKTAIWSDLSQASVILNNEFFESGTSVNVTPGTGELVFEGYSPVVSTPVVITPEVGSIVITGFEPTVQVPINILTNTGELILTGFAPEVTISPIPVPTPQQIGASGGGGATFTTKDRLAIRHRQLRQDDEEIMIFVKAFLTHHGTD